MIPILLAAPVVMLGLFLVLARGSRVPERAATATATDGLPHVRGPVRRRPSSTEDQRELVEAIASWTENLRDAVTASRGIEQAIIASADHCPARLREDVARLVANLRYSDLNRSMRTFADAVDHPACDFVAAALVTASAGAARDVAGLLGHLAECAREESETHLRVWVSRARIRTSVRMVIGSVVAFVSGLVVLQPGYLSPFFVGPGPYALMTCGLMFAVAIRWMQMTARVTGPARFVGRRTAG